MPAYNTNLMWGPASVGWRVPQVTTANDYHLDDADDSIATAFIVPKDGTIDRIGCYVRALVGNPPEYNVGLMVVTNATGFPDTTTNYGGSATEGYDFAATGWVWITLTTPAVVAAGDYVAACVWPGVVAPDGGNYVAVEWYDGAGGGWQADMRYWLYAAAWSGSYGWAVAAMYDDGEVAIPAIVGNTYATIHTGTAPDEIGCRFTVPFNCTCVGASVGINPAANADFDVCLYDAADVLLGSNAVDVSERQANSYYTHVVQWDAVNLTAGATYRVTILPTTANNGYALAFTLNELASRYWWPEGRRWQQTERTDAGAWTDTPLKLAMLALNLTSITA